MNKKSKKSKEVKISPEIVLHTIDDFDFNDDFDYLETIDDHGKGLGLGYDHLLSYKYCKHCFGELKNISDNTSEDDDINPGWRDLKRKIARCKVCKTKYSYREVQGLDWKAYYDCQYFICLHCCVKNGCGIYDRKYGWSIKEGCDCEHCDKVERQYFIDDVRWSLKENAKTVSNEFYGRLPLNEVKKCRYCSNNMSELGEEHEGYLDDWIPEGSILVADEVSI
jgi:hypothetical protein